MDETSEETMHMCKKCGLVFTNGHILLLGSGNALALCPTCFSNNLTIQDDDGQEDAPGNETDENGGEGRKDGEESECYQDLEESGKEE